MARIIVYQYDKCGTCKKALRWLDANEVAYDAVDITQSPPSKQELRRVLAKSGLPIRKLFNTSGAAYREGGYGKRLETLSEDEALAELAGNGRLIKRPLVVGPALALVGFREADYAAAFGRAS